MQSTITTMPAKLSSQVLLGIGVVAACRCQLLAYSNFVL